MKSRQIEPKIYLCDFKNPMHTQALVGLLAEYMDDDMGGAPPHSVDAQNRLVKELAAHSSAFVLLAEVDGVFVGMATCFVNYSTFRCAPYINIHDLVVSANYRGKGLGKAIMSEIIEIAAQKQYCKVNLEVRTDNEVAMNLYHELGFNDCNPPMKFWEKII
jgi:ribosomal protein S18 acetylase RimI-like enzyme